MNEEKNAAIPTFWLSLSLRVMAVGFGIFFLALGLHSLRFANFGETYLSLVRWGSHGEAYELMICVIYLAWAPFLWRAAKNPLKEKTLIDLTIVVNVVHFGTMFVQGLVMEGEHVHLYGDILLGWLGLLPLIVFWLPVRGKAR